MQDNLVFLNNILVDCNIGMKLEIFCKQRQLFSPAKFLSNVITLSTATVGNARNTVPMLVAGEGGLAGLDGIRWETSIL